MSASHALLAWFRANARPLPWREERRDPYRVLLSEIMLQQTQVDRVVPLFEAFVRRFPDLAGLAAATEDEVVAAWSGLGYYRRARALHSLARRLVAGDGRVPDTVAELLELPGMGPYTAAAVASLAFGQPEPAVDGNVLRVGARVLALDGDPRAAGPLRQVRGWVLELMRGASAGEINEALIELGATVCRPTRPACVRCPLTSLCRARESGRPEAYPRPRRARRPQEHRWVAACLQSRRGRWLLRRVGDGPILRGLWLPPWTDVAVGEDPVAAAVRLSPVAAGAAEVLPAVGHAITHRRISVVPVVLEVEEDRSVGPGWRWVDPASPGVPTSSLLAKLLAACRGRE